MNKTKYINVIVMDNREKVNVTLEERLDAKAMQGRKPRMLYDCLTGASILYDPAKVTSILSTMVIDDNDADAPEDDSSTLIL